MCFDTQNDGKLFTQHEIRFQLLILVKKKLLTANVQTKKNSPNICLALRKSLIYL